MPSVVWVVEFSSGREVIGDYFTSVYDGQTGALLLNVVIYVPPSVRA